MKLIVKKYFLFPQHYDIEFKRYSLELYHKYISISYILDTNYKIGMAYTKVCYFKVYVLDLHFSTMKNPLFFSKNLSTP